MIDKPLPMDLDAERGLLGSMLNAGPNKGAPWSIEDLEAIVDSTAFFDVDHRTIFNLLCRMHAAGEPIDIITVMAELKQSRPEAGGDWQPLLIGIAESVPDWSNAEHYAKLVRKAFQRRRLIQLGERAMRAGHDSNLEISQLISEFTTNALAIDEASIADREPSREADQLYRLENYRASDYVQVGLGQLEFALDGGLELGTLTICGARPSCGKTSLALTVARNAASAPENPAPVILFSIEMSCSQIAHRLLAARANLPLRRIRSGELTQSEFNEHRNRAAQEAESYEPIFIVDDIRDVHAICAVARRAVRKHGVRLIAVDYLGLIEMPGRFDRHDLKLAAISATFKYLAKQTGAAVLLCSQLNRRSSTEGRPPTLADLRDSGAIEQDADVVLLLNPREKETTQNLCATDIIIAKHRQGETSTVPVLYRRSTQTFEPQPVSYDASPGGSSWHPGG